MPKGQRTNPTAIAALERRLLILEQRKAGRTFVSIAAEHAWNVAYIQRDFRKWYRLQVAEEVDEYRKVQLARLEALLNAHWEKAIAGGIGSTHACLVIMRQIADLLGLNAPTRTQIEGEGTVRIVYSGDDWADGVIETEAVEVKALPGPPPNGNGNGGGHDGPDVARGNQE